MRCCAPEPRMRDIVSSNWSESHQPSMYASPNPSVPSANTRANRRSSWTWMSHGAGPFIATSAGARRRSACSLNLSFAMWVP